MITLINQQREIKVKVAKTRLYLMLISTKRFFERKVIVNKKKK